jgi:dTDP-4-amino-4,6-dideoxygalactose transaminase
LVVALERAGVETRFLLPILGQACYDGVLELVPERYPVTSHALANGFYIGCHHKLSDADIDHVVEVVTSASGSR